MAACDVARNIWQALGGGVGEGRRARGRVEEDEPMKFMLKAPGTKI